MDALKDAIDHQDWPTALSVANALELDTLFIHKHILAQQLSSTDQTTALDISSVENVFQTDPIWVARLIVNFSQKSSPSSSSSKCSYDEEKKLVKILSNATDFWLDTISTDRDLSLRQVLPQTIDDLEDETTLETLKELIQEDEQVAEACSAKWLSTQFESKWNLYEDIHRSNRFISQNSTDDTLNHQKSTNDGELEDTTNWGDLDLNPIQALGETDDQVQLNTSFFSFCQSDLNDLAFSLASKLQLNHLRRLLETGNIPVEPTSLFDTIPLHARPSDMEYGPDFIALLPRPQTKSKPHDRPKTVIDSLFNSIQQQPQSSNLTDQQLTQWYLSRVEAIDDLTGCIDAAIEIIQHGAASGVLGLESIAEDLSLLGKLLYDAPYSSGKYDWTLDQWMSKSPDEIVQAYLAGSTPISLVKDIHRLVLPYLGLLESRRARASVPGAESTIPDGLRTWALGLSNNLPMLETLIKASSPSLKLPERPIKSNEDLARILASCLYTSSSVDDWERMGRMFECMPAFPDQIPTSDEFNSADYLHEILSSASGSTLWRSQGTHFVYNALSQLDTGRLSSILDGLDDHLATAEVLARWNVPNRLGDLVMKLHGNKVAQQKLATRIARQEGGVEMESEEEWEVLLEAMIELSQPGRALDLLAKNEIIKLFFSGLLTSGKFKLAQALFSSSSDDPLLDSTAQEELVIAASREFYDNAESGNIHSGEMKMAYDCLTVAPSSLNIKRERDFIEATSRLTSFNIESQPGILMTPIEIRLKTNKLELIDQVLKVSPTAYQHQDMVIDLVNKLGYREDLLLQIQALSMVVDYAIGEGDLLAATQTCERMISILESIKKRSRLVESQSRVDEASRVIWQTCEKIGKHSQRFKSSSSELNNGFKTKFLAHAIIICPPDHIPRLLNEWRQAEKEEEDYSLLVNNRSELLNRSTKPDSTSHGPLWNSIKLERSQTHSNHRPSNSITNKIGDSSGLPGGELASRTLERAASLFPFKAKTLPLGPKSPPKSDLLNKPNEHHDLPISQNPENAGRLERNFSEPLNSLVGSNSERPRFGVGVDTDRLTTALSNKFTSGVGWLIGANEDELR